MMLLVSNAMDWFFTFYNTTPFAGVLLCWAAFVFATAVVLSVNRAVIGKMTGFVISMTGTVWILTYMDLSTFYGLEKQGKEVIKNLVIMSLGGVGSALLVSAMLTKPRRRDEIRQREFIRSHVMAVFKILFWFGLFASLLVLILSAGLALFAHPVTTNGQFIGLMVSTVLASVGLPVAEVGKRWVKLQGLLLLTLLGLFMLLLAVFFQSLVGIWLFSPSAVIGSFTAALVCLRFIGFRVWGRSNFQETISTPIDQ
ncbi:hypothetical protein [Pseudomonas sp. 3-2]|uniref:hypothetical protein n=1 Tax=Pseudomonas sp. 3-2 TaxID=2867408 RepID=UPI001C87115A|nr:hypothetical protein [Pseudomonas sp. 3-2]QZD70877.1 hypothetical protein K3819_27260 [Pseudomonas sp. 3-2]